MIDASSAVIDSPIVSGYVSHTRNAIRLDLDWVDKRSVLDAAFSSLNAALARLSHLGPDWDGYGSDRPNGLAIARAAELVKALHRDAWATGYAWFPPLVSANESGDVSFEWWRGEHKLTIYIEAERTRFIKVWGPNVDNDMADGEIVADRFAGLWRWLNAA